VIGSKAIVMEINDQDLYDTHRAEPAADDPYVDAGCAIYGKPEL
jgi:hypothetical protein